MPADEQARFISRILDVIECDIVPLTAGGVARGDKVFGAAIILKSDLSLAVAGTNNETANPLFHNAYWTSQGLAGMIGNCAEPERTDLAARVAAIAGIYDDMSGVCQAPKGGDTIPLD